MYTSAKEQYKKEQLERQLQEIVTMLLDMGVYK